MSQLIPKWLTQTVQIIGLTLLLLEIVVRVVWWSSDTVSLLNTKITLLPWPLVAERQRNLLAEWSMRADAFLKYDPTLGWTVHPNTTINHKDINYTANSIGIRALREYDPQKPTDITRIAAFGPSYTFADEVHDYQSWPIHLEQSNPNLEVMNWGVNGYGLDQAFLRYQTQGAAYKPDVVLIDYEQENKYRLVTRFRPYQKRGTLLPLTKPVFVVEEAGLRLIANPFDNFADFHQTLTKQPDRFLALTCQHDFFCHPSLYSWQPIDHLASMRLLKTLAYEINPDWLAPPPTTINPDETARQVIKMFINEVRNNQATPVVVLFPNTHTTMIAYEQGIPAEFHQLIPFIETLDVTVIDLTDIFVQAKQDHQLQYEEFFVRGAAGGHYSELGNYIVAQAIWQTLCNQKVITQCT